MILVFRPLAVLAAVFLLSRAGASAGQLYLQNAGFEETTLNEGGYIFQVPGWSGDDNGPTGCFVERLGFNDGGTNNLGMEAGTSLLQDVSGEAYRPDTLYALRAGVGNRIGWTQPGNLSSVTLSGPNENTYRATTSVDASTFPVSTFGQVLVRFAHPEGGYFTGRSIRVKLNAGGKGRSHFDNIRLFSVGTFTGGDSYEGLDLNGDFVYAVKVGGSGAPGLVRDANFTADNVSGVTITGANGVIDAWSNPSYGFTLNDDRMEQVMRSMRYSSQGKVMTVTLANLQPGVPHKLQLLFVEQSTDRAFDVKVDGVMVFDDFRPRDFDATGVSGGTPAGKPLVITHTFVPSTTTATITLDGTTVAAGAGTGREPMLSGFTLERLGPLTMDFSEGLGDGIAKAYGTGGDTGEVGGGVLTLTAAEEDSGAQTGSVTMHPFTGNLPVDAFDVTFDAFAGTGSPTPGAGYTFCWGARVPYKEFGGNVPPDYGGLVVNFGIPSAGGGAAEVAVYWDGVKVGAVPCNVFTNAFVPMHIRMRPGGLLDVRQGDTRLISGLRLAGFAPQIAPRWGFGGHVSGGDNVRLALDNVSINPFPVTVTTLADSGPGSLRDALAFTASFSRPGPDQIRFSPALNGGIIRLAGTALSSGDQAVTVDASMLPAGITIDGNKASGVWKNDGFTPNVLMNRLTVTGGMAGASLEAGGVSVQGQLTMEDCSVVGNEAVSGVGGLISMPGAVLNMTRCTVSGNTSPQGSAIGSFGQTTLTRCTIYGNRASQGAGGFVCAGGSTVIAECTVYGNTGWFSGGIYLSSGGLEIRDSIVAGNTVPLLPFGWPVAQSPDFYETGGDLKVKGVNLIGILNNSKVTELTPGLPNVYGNFVGTPAAPLDPGLLPPGNYGGYTLTLHPRPGSPAIDPPGGLTTASSGQDARGFARLADGDGNGTVRQDIGAVEAGRPVTVTNANDSGSGSLRAAVAAITEPGQRILFAPALNGATISPETEIVLDRSLFMDASTLPSGLRIHGRNTHRVFSVPERQMAGAQPIGITLPSGSTALQSTEYGSSLFPGVLALDGNPANFTATAEDDVSPAWTVTLGREVRLSGITLHNRDDCCQDRLSNVVIRLLDANDGLVLQSPVLNAANAQNGPATLRWNTGTAVTARKIQVRRTSPGVLSLGEVEVSLGSVPEVTMAGFTLSGGYAGAETGGALAGKGRVSLLRMTLEGNSASSAGSGGALALQGAESVLSLDHCTLTGNTAGSAGALLLSQGAARLVHCTVARNAATGSLNPGGIRFADGSALALTNTIVAENTATPGMTSPDLLGSAAALYLQGVNLAGVAPSGLSSVMAAGTPNARGDFAGTSASPLAPMLLPAGDYGGPTRTLPPRTGGVVQDRVPANGVPAAGGTDQRGLARVLWGRADIGAVEAGVSAANAWEVREVTGSMPLNTLAQAEALAANPLAASFTGTRATVNFADPGTNPDGGGYFGGKIPFLSDNRTPQGLLNGDDNDFVTVARTFVRITGEDYYTFGFSSAGGARLRVFGATFFSSTKLNPANPAASAHDGDTLSFPGVTQDSATLGVCYLKLGVYAVEFLTWERDGPAHAEVFAARGMKAVFDTDSRLLGDPGAPDGSLMLPRPETFTQGDGGYLPSGTLAGDKPWTYQASTGTWSVEPSASNGTARLTSTPFTITRTGPVTLSFNHRYSFFTGVDASMNGGQVLVSVNNANFTLLPGSRFSSNGYTGTVSAQSLNSPLRGQEAFIYTSPGYGSGQFIPSTASLGFLQAGDTVRVRFLYGEYPSAASSPAWEITSVALQENNLYTDLGWEVAVGRNNEKNLADAIRQVTAAWSGDRPPNTQWTSTPNLNFTASSNGTGQPAFPGNAGSDGNGFALGARATFVVSADGDYTFYVRGNDAVRFRIIGSRGWIPAGSAGPTMLPDGILTGPPVKETLVQVRLPAGNYEMEFIYRGNGGTAYCGLWYARGKYSTFDPLVFNPVGPTLAGAPLVLTRQSGLSERPLNDDFASAFNLTGSRAWAAGNNTGATMETGELSPGDQSGKSLWWVWTAPSSGEFTVDVTAGDFAALPVVYTGSTLATAVPVTGVNTPYRPATFQAAANTTYHIQLNGWRGAAGNIRLYLGPSVPPPVGPPAQVPSNDAFAQAAPLTGATVTVSGNTTLATSEAGEPGQPYASVWYAWKAPATADFVIDTMGSGFDTVLKVYTGNSLADLELIASNDDWGSTASRVVVGATAGMTYWIAVDGSAYTKGSYLLNITRLSTGILSGVLTPGPVTDTYTLRWESGPGALYRIEQSANLIDWTPVTDCYADPGDSTVMDLTGIPATRQRVYFRVLLR